MSADTHPYHRIEEFRMARKHGSAFIGVCVAVAAPFLAGCSIAVDTEVSAAGMFTGSYTTTVSSDAMSGMPLPGMGDETTKADLVPKPAEEVMEPTEWVEGNVSGKTSVNDEGELVSTVLFTDATTDQINAAMAKHATQETSGGMETTSEDEFPLQATVVGDSVTVSFAGDSDTTETGVSEGLGSDSAMGTEMLESMLNGMTLDVTVVMPGVISDVSGVLPDAATTNDEILVGYDQSTVRLKVGMGELVKLGEKYMDIPTAEQPELFTVTSPTTGGVGRTTVEWSTTSSPTIAPDPSIPATTNPAPVTENSGSPASTPAPIIFFVGAAVLLGVGLTAGFLLAKSKS